MTKKETVHLVLVSVGITNLESNTMRCLQPFTNVSIVYGMYACGNVPKLLHSRTCSIF